MGVVDNYAAAASPTRNAALGEGTAITTLISLAHNDRHHRIAITDRIINEHHAGRPLPSPATVAAWVRTGAPPRCAADGRAIPDQMA